MPPNWDADFAPGPAVIRPALVQLQPGTYEWTQVVHLFLDDNMVDLRPGDIVVERIERVHNKHLWTRYQARRAQIEINHGGAPNEKWLKHGTRTTPPSAIWGGNIGLDAAFVSGMFGRAVYCADAMEYSHRYLHNLPGQPGRAQVFLVKFLAGRIEDRDRIETSIVGPSPNHDCIRGNVGGPGSCYMSYSPHTTYPMYLITYRFPVK